MSGFERESSQIEHFAIKYDYTPGLQDDTCIPRVPGVSK